MGLRSVKWLLNLIYMQIYDYSIEIMGFAGDYLVLFEMSEFRIKRVQSSEMVSFLQIPDYFACVSAPLARLRLECMRVAAGLP